MNDSSTQQHATTQEPSGWRAALLLYSKGIAMGLGDSVPGISGGTIAVLTNIYDRLIFSCVLLIWTPCVCFFQAR